MTKRATRGERGEGNELDHVLDAAARLFRRQGFAATTVREIAAEAGMLPGSLHYRFASKERILLALMRRALTRAEQAVGSAAASTSDPIERLRLGLLAHLRLLLSGDDSFYVLLYDWRALAGSARRTMIALRDHYEQLWASLLTDAARTGHFRRDLDLHLARLLGFGAVNWIAQWYSPDGERTPEEIAAFCWEILCFGLFDERTRPAGAGGLLARHNPCPAPAAAG